MPLTHWLAWLALTAAACAGSAWWYHRRETVGRGRLSLALLRGGAVSLILLLLFDPVIRGPGAGEGTGTVVLLDASLSMNLPAGSRSRWAEAVDRAQNHAGAAILLFGSGVRPATVSLPDSSPGDASSRLLPALQAAAEAGARHVVVVTDGGIEDAAQVAQWSARLGLEIEVETVGSAIANRSLIDIQGPRWTPADEPVALDFRVLGADTPQDSVTVVARRDGRVIGRAAVADPGPGRVASGSVEVRLDASDSGAPVAVELALEPTDAVPDDDARTVYIEVGEEPAGIALVSFRPDWEPRFLAPALERALGLPIRAFLRGAAGQYMRVGRGLEAGVQVEEGVVQEAVERGELVVLHGLGGDAPAWALEAGRNARRVIVFPGEGDTGVLPVATGPESGGDFWILPQLPPSPVAALLTGLDLDALTPLSGLSPVEEGTGVWVPLEATRGRQGARLPLFVGGEEAGRRWVAALGNGYWQWAFRGGVEAEVYNRVWAALAGWLFEQSGVTGGPGVRPVLAALPRLAAVPWLVPGPTPDSVRIVLTDGAGSASLDTVIRAFRGDTLVSAAPGPGTYRYDATVFAGPDTTRSAGALTIDRYSPEYARASADLVGIEGTMAAIRGDAFQRGSGTPLHATPFPWILIVALLATEWVLRRRWGLR